LGLTENLMNEKWIWLDRSIYPQYQNTYYTTFADKTGFNFCVAEFKNKYKLAKKAVTANIEVCGDTKFRLWINKRYVGSGPVCPGGDYGNKLPMPNYYSSSYTVSLDLCREISFFAQIQLSPVVMTDVSCGRGGFVLVCHVIFEDGTCQIITTDESWQSRANPCYISENNTDYTLEQEAWRPAEIIRSVWNLKKSPIPVLHEERIVSTENTEIMVKARTQKTITTQLDKIYSGYMNIEIEARVEYDIIIDTFEVIGSNLYFEKIKACGDISYRSLRMQSIGGYTVTIINKGNKDIKIKEVSIIFTCYPITVEGSFECSDSVLNKIYEVGRHTARICRQSLHLDSPTHQENLGCTGDYFIESLIDYYLFGDTRLTRFDIVRTADYLKMMDGFMFHTSYSLIWIQMIKDYLIYSGDSMLWEEIQDAVHILLERFEGYIGTNGVIENPQNYMFIDWIPVDEFNLHHPPKALGQTAVTAFYYKALTDAAELCKTMGDEHAELYVSRAEAVKESFNRLFFDQKRCLYFDGLNTPSKTNEWLPENPQKRYYSKHSNTLAVLYDLCEQSRQRSIMEAVMKDDTLIDVQPYFMHYVLEAVYKTGLFYKYGLNSIKRWEKLVNECDKGMKEAWGNYPGYEYDYSHAWGATPTYQLPSKLLGFKMLKPGFKEISLMPNLYGLKYAKITMPTPFGTIECNMKEGENPQLKIPVHIKFNVY